HRGRAEHVLGAVQEEVGVERDVFDQPAPEAPRRDALAGPAEPRALVAGEQLALALLQLPAARVVLGGVFEPALHADELAGPAASLPKSRRGWQAAPPTQSLEFTGHCSCAALLSATLPPCLGAARSPAAERQFGRRRGATGRRAEDINSPQGATKSLHAAG